MFSLDISTQLIIYNEVTLNESKVENNERPNIFILSKLHKLCNLNSRVMSRLKTQTNINTYMKSSVARLDKGHLGHN